MHLRALQFPALPTILLFAGALMKTSTSKVNTANRLQNALVEYFAGEHTLCHRKTVADPPPPKTYERNLIQHNFAQFGKQHWRYEAILQSIISSEAVMRLDHQILLKSPPQHYWLDPPLLQAVLCCCSSRFNRVLFIARYFR